MFSLLGKVLVSAIGESAVKEIANSIFRSQKRRALRRAIRDVIEDEIQIFAGSMNIEKEQVDKYIKNHKRHIKDEIRARFDAIFRN